MYYVLDQFSVLTPITYNTVDFSEKYAYLSIYASAISPSACVAVFEFVSPKIICYNPNPQDLRM